MSTDFKEQLKLDKYALDKCALEQPELYAHWALQWAAAVRERDRLKDKLALERSEADIEIRSKPRDWGWNTDKAPTEAFISAAISSHEKVMDVNELYLEACHNVNVLSIAKDSFEQRRRMIEVLSDLYRSDYFSGNPDFDKSYQNVVGAAAVEAQSKGLESNSRLIARSRRNANDTSHI